MWQYLAIGAALFFAVGYLVLFARKVLRGKVDGCGSCGSGSATAPKVKVTPIVSLGVERNEDESSSQ